MIKELLRKCIDKAKYKYSGICIMIKLRLKVMANDAQCLLRQGCKAGQDNEVPVRRVNKRRTKIFTWMFSPPRSRTMARRPSGTHIRTITSTLLHVRSVQDLVPEKRDILKKVANFEIPSIGNMSANKQGTY